MRQADIKFNDLLAGRLVEDEEGYHFTYSDQYLQDETSVAISFTIPLQSEEFQSSVLFPFFDGLIPEGWLLDLVYKNWKLNTRDRMALLLACCRDCIGAVSVHEVSGTTH